MRVNNNGINWMGNGFEDRTDEKCFYPVNFAAEAVT